ncbi:hydrolase [Gracilibacillus marinus]|uniref:Hydrolase n=1 Tax=Gracilibacillus marinus TaxID=630535 RepID=A0ABV8W043_9BACI
MTAKTYFYDSIPVVYDIAEEEKKTILSKFPAALLPNEQTTFRLDEAEKGQHIRTTLLVSDYEVKQTKTNKRFLKISFQNQSGNIPAKMWDNNDAVATSVPLLEKHAVFQIDGQVDEFNGYKSVTVRALTPHTENIDPFQLLAFTKQNMDELTLELFSYIHDLQEPFKSISLHAMDAMWESFRLSPAAKGHHHNYLGGLLKHTIGLMRFCRYIVKLEENPFQAVIKLIHQVEKQYKQEIWHDLKQDTDVGTRFVWKDTIDHLYSMLHGMSAYKLEQINYDALMTSILFHDIGKLLEYDYASKSLDTFTYLYPTAYFEEEQRKQAGISMDPLGVMVGHIPYGVLLLNKVIESNNVSISMESIHLMTHCILCHHGLPEWGSAVKKPLNIEGYIIHIVDFLDSRYENTEKDSEK